MNPSAWKVVAASVCGASHARRGQPCQDEHRWQILHNHALLAAVADGAGSALLGEVGAAVAAQTAVHAARQLLHPDALNHPEFLQSAWKTRLLEILAASQGAIDAEAAARDVPPRDLATTLIVLLATPRFVAAAQVGDGSAVVADSDNNLLALTGSRSSAEYVNQTTFLTSPDALQTAETSLWIGSPSAVALLSDGLQSIALKESRLDDDRILKTPHPPFFAPLFRFLNDNPDPADARQQLASFLASPRITQRADDDLTLLLAIPPAF